MVRWQLSPALWWLRWGNVCNKMRGNPQCPLKPWNSTKAPFTHCSYFYPPWSCRARLALFRVTAFKVAADGWQHLRILSSSVFPQRTGFWVLQLSLLLFCPWMCQSIRKYLGLEFNIMFLNKQSWKTSESQPEVCREVQAHRVQTSLLL